MDKGQEIAKPDYIESNKDQFTSVARISRDYQVYFVHKIVPRWITKEDQWTLLREGLTDVNILSKVVVATQPEIACSTVEEGDSDENFLNEDRGIGLLIIGGNIKFAGATDAFTKVEEARVKDGNTDDAYEANISLTPFAQKAIGQEIQTEEDIWRAIKARRKSTKDASRYDFTPYNEFSVANPKVGAIFTVIRQHIGYNQEKNDLDNLLRKYEIQSNSFGIDESEKERLEQAKGLAQEFDVPLLVFYKGSFYRVNSLNSEGVEEDEPRKTRVYLGEKISIEDSLALKDPLSKNPGKRSDFIKEIYKAKPFKDSNAVRLMKKSS